MTKGVFGGMGNLKAQSKLLAYLQGGRIHPAVILGGGEPVAKFAIVKNIAKYFLCTTPNGKMLYCDQCSACRKIEKNCHPDLLLLEEKGEDTIKIATIREYCSQMDLGPVEGKAKICIIDECHRMNAASANAFLKTLEEPGPDRYFWLLTSQTGSLLPTIVSRCLKFTFQPESTPVVEAFKINYGELFQKSLTSKDPELLMDALDSKEKAVDFIAFLKTRFRDAAVDISSGIKPKEFLANQTIYACLNYFDAALALEGRLRSNANYALMLESFLNRHFLQGTFSI